MLPSVRDFKSLIAAFKLIYTKFETYNKKFSDNETMGNPL